MEDLESKLNSVYTVLVDAVGTAAMTAGIIHDRRIRDKVNEILKDEAIHMRELRKRLFSLLNE